MYPLKESESRAVPSKKDKINFLFLEYLKPRATYLGQLTKDQGLVTKGARRCRSEGRGGEDPLLTAGGGKDRTRNIELHHLILNRIREKG